MENNIGHPKESFYNFVFWSVCIILFLPIVISPLSLQPLDWTRVTVLKIIVIGVILFFLYKFFYKKDISVFLPSKNWSFYLALGSLCGYYFLLIASTIFSQDIKLSIFGSPAR